MKLTQSSQELVKSGLISGLSDSFKNIFVQITLKNTGLQLSSNNKITYVEKGLSQSTASLEARLDCSEPHSGDFTSSPVIVTQQPLGNLLNSLTIPAMKHCCSTSASEDFRNHIRIPAAAQMTRQKQLTYQ